MFTGIIETIGQVERVTISGTNKIFLINSPLSNELKVDQSISHSGVCLTVEAAGNGQHQVTAIAETLQKTNLALWQPGTRVNLERCMVMNGRLDGHIVQGHVDTIATCIERQALDGSHLYRFRFPEAFTTLVIEKGSISLNGISLTIFDVTRDTFAVAIIPYTYEHTDLQDVHSGSVVNLEFDMVGKYVNRIMEQSHPVKN